MAAVSYNKFHDFGHTLLVGDNNCSTDELSIYLTDAAPAATMIVKATLAEITATGGYAAGGIDTVNTVAQDTTSGIWKVGCTASMQWTSATASGQFPSFRYVVLFNETSSTGAGDTYTDQLIAWWDYGSSVWTTAPGNGDTFTVSCTNNKLFTINSVS